ncbi:MAG: heme exporter protein CcmB [Desulfovibrionaceae bacterium]|nr:heme exporter protein CcmB [Desulfovibrionaceae bacterium]
MLRCALAIAAKDLRLTVARGTGLVQALLLGLLLIFVFSLARQAGQELSGQAAAAVFWLASAFCQVLVFNALYSLEETNGQRTALLLSPAPAHAVWLGKALAGWLLILAAQLVFVPATVIFLGQSLGGDALTGLGVLLAADWGLVALGSLLGALAQGQAARESLLSIILFPLLIPVLLAGVRIGAAVFAAGAAPDAGRWLGIVLAFDALFSGAGLILFPFVYGSED